MTMEIKTLTHDFEVLAQVQPGQKLEITDQGLAIVPYRHWVMSYFTGETPPSNQAVTEHLEKMSQVAKTILLSPNLEEKAQLSQALSHAKQNLPNIKEMDASADPDSIVSKITDLCEGLSDPEKREALNLSYELEEPPSSLTESWQNPTAPVEREHSFSELRAKLDPETKKIMPDSFRTDFIPSPDDNATSDFFWGGHDGHGPSFIGGIFSKTTTAIELVKGFIAPPDEKLFAKIPKSYQGFVRDVMTPGKQLDGAAIKELIGIMKKLGADFESETDFLSSSLDKYTLSEAERNLRDLVRKSASGKPIVIPIVVGQDSYFERQHIACIFVKNKQIYYYDSKGISSDQRKLKDGSTVRDLLNSCNRLLGKSSMTIKENPITHQYDSHNCGGYVSNFLFQTVIRQHSPESLESKDFSTTYINSFRNTLGLDLATYLTTQSEISIQRTAQTRTERVVTKYFQDNPRGAINADLALELYERTYSGEAQVWFQLMSEKGISTIDEVQKTFTKLKKNGLITLKPGSDSTYILKSR